jgi:hypothetical protein
MRLVRKFDPVERDFRNRSLGKAGEEMVFTFERQHLTAQGRADLARKVRWVSQEVGTVPDTTFARSIMRVRSA